MTKVDPQHIIDILKTAIKLLESLQQPEKMAITLYEQQCPEAMIQLIRDKIPKTLRGYEIVEHMKKRRDGPFPHHGFPEHVIKSHLYLGLNARYTPNKTIKYLKKQTAKGQR